MPRSLKRMIEEGQHNVNCRANLIFLICKFKYTFCFYYEAWKKNLRKFWAYVLNSKSRIIHINLQFVVCKCLLPHLSFEFWLEEIKSTPHFAFNQRQLNFLRYFQFDSIIFKRIKEIARSVNFSYKKVKKSSNSRCLSAPDCFCVLSSWSCSYWFF